MTYDIAIALKLNRKYIFNVYDEYMEQIVFERPREKLRNRGASYLTTIELLQLVLGSGGPGVSGARLAKRIDRLIGSGAPKFEDLMSMKGIGLAKACQILAVLELSRRLSSEKKQARRLSPSFVHSIIQEAQYRGLGRLTCYWFDGSMHQIDQKTYVVQAKLHHSVFIRNVFADALAATARSVVIVIAMKEDVRSPVASHFNLMHIIRTTADLLQISVLDVYAVNKKEYISWNSEL